MKIFQCGQCRAPVFFENTVCGHCQSPLGFDHNRLTLVTLKPQGETFLPIGEDRENPRRFCQNHQSVLCNWLVDSSSDESLCPACELNRYVPNLASDQRRQGWKDLEHAKHRVVYSVLKLGLPLQSKHQDPESGLLFDFIDPNHPVPADAMATTGHADGEITVSVEEADPAQREQNRVDLNEQYRTLIGHIRHEIGHYYWDQLIADDAARLSQYRELFGDESVDYGSALEKHYQEGPRSDWQQYHISAYAASHPWEDWAETWAHYLHLMDLLETAHSVGLSVQPSQAGSPLAVALTEDPYCAVDFSVLLDQAIPLTVVLNSLNRSMGQPDLYPFVLSDPVRQKLMFIHQVVCANARASAVEADCH